MRKYILNVLPSDNAILFIIAAVFCLSTWFYMSFTKPRDIEYKYDGIKYQIGNLESAEAINIEIKGKLTKELFGDHGKYGEFNGTIKVGERIFSSRPIAFNKDKMTSLDLNKGIYGMIFIDDMFKKLTIEILEPDVQGGYSWNGNNGWMVSAPCDDRAEAVKISNMLDKKLDGQIK